jgi:hypothetical protein
MSWMSAPAPNAPDRTRLAPLAMAVGGALAVASYLLNWATLSFPGPSNTETVVHIGHRNVALFFGILLLARGVMTLRLGRSAGRAWGGFAIVTGAILAGYAVYDLLTLRSVAVDVLVSNTVDQLGMTVAEVRALVDAQIAQGLLRVAFLPGIFLALAGGLLGIMGGVQTLREPKPGRDEGSTPTDAPVTAWPRVGR